MKKKLLSLLLALAMCLSLSVPAWAVEKAITPEDNTANNRIVTLQEKGFFVETFYGEGENALHKLSSEKTKSEIKEHLSENSLTLISVSSKSIYLKEKSFENGTVTYVPMTKSEVMKTQLFFENNASVRAIENPSPKQYGKLTITLTVSNNARHQIWIDTRADWEAPTLYGDVKLQPAGGDDRYAVTWGANTVLSASSASCNGNYRNGQSIDPVRERIGEPGVYQWRFAERTTSGSAAEKIYSTIVLSPNVAYQGNTTWCEFTYTHNYYIAVNQLAEWPISIDAQNLPY